MKAPGRIGILGAGPTGLGAAWRLDELGYDDWFLLEAEQGPGGLASSHVDEHGFTWDLGGHVQFSHYRYYDEVLERAVAGGWLEHDRESWVWIRGGFVPYPFQYNIHRLPRKEQEQALAGLRAAARASRSDAPAPAHFGEWILRTFGAGIAEVFMEPYNFKVWGYPLDQLEAGWVGERVAVPDLERVERCIASGQDDVSWGPNNRFLFPRRGGTGRIWRDVASRLPAERLRFGERVRGVSVPRSEGAIDLHVGEPREDVPATSSSCDTLISTIPLDRLVAMVDGASAQLRAEADRLRYSSVHVVGLGLRGARPGTLQRKCWMYFPEANSPYYRVTVFSNYSPENVPAQEVGAEPYWSLMAEVCESPHRAVNSATVVEDVVRALLEDGLLLADTEVVSRWHRRLHHGYPTPFLGRDEVLDRIHADLEPMRIFSRGRFGGWRYEVSNQDHSFMQGVELVDRLLGVGDEVTYPDPPRANSGAFLERVSQRQIEAADSSRSSTS